MIADIASKKACSGTSGGANTGKLGCLSLFGSPAHLIALQRGTTILATDDFNQAYLLDLVQRGIAIPLLDATGFEDVSSEDSYSTNARGIKRLNIKGLPEYKLTFEEGHEFYRELAKLESFKSYDYIIGDTDGNWMLVKKSDGNFQGFSGGHTTPELTKRKVEGGEAESKALLIQFIDRLQWDQGYEILHAEDLDFTPSEVPVVNGTEIKYNTVPGASDTVLDVSVVLASDRNTIVEGLVSGDFVVTKNGATAAHSGVVEGTPGNYQITLSAALAASDVIKVDHFDGTANSVVAESAGVLYRNSYTNQMTVS